MFGAKLWLPQMQTEIAQRLGLQPFDHCGPPMVVGEQRLHADMPSGPEHYLRRAAGCAQNDPAQRREAMRVVDKGDG